MPLTIDEARLIASRESFVVAPPLRPEVVVEDNSDLTLEIHDPDDPVVTMKATIASGTWGNGHAPWFAQATRKLWLDMYYTATGKNGGAQASAR